MCQGISPRVELSPPWHGKLQADLHIVLQIPWLTPIFVKTMGGPQLLQTTCRIHIMCCKITVYLAVLYLIVIFVYFNKV